MCVLIFFKLLCETFLILRTIEQRTIYTAMLSTHYSSQILLNLFYLGIFHVHTVYLDNNQSIFTN